MNISFLHINFGRLCYTCALFIFIFGTFACKKLVEVPLPITDVTKPRAFNSDGNAIAAVTGLYQVMQSIFTGNNSITVYTGLSADELHLSPSITTADSKSYVYTNSLLISASGPSSGFNFWTTIYSYIYNCNSALSGLSDATNLTPTVRQQLTGEILFLRAFFYYYLLNLYGDVPLVLGTEYKVNATLPRSPTSQVWQKIAADLDSARTLLNPQYPDASLTGISSERVRPTQGAALAMLARLYLYMGNWQLAEQQSSLLINNSTLYHLEALQNVFLKNSTEAIWQLQPIAVGWNTEDARVFIIPATGLDSYMNTVYLNDRLLDSFEPIDQRRQEWIDSITVNGITYHYPYKYKSAIYGDPVSEYQMILRLGEQYLIRAEARAMQGNLAAARADLNVIRNRAGLPDTNANTQSKLLNAILQERRAELFTELGQRWADLKRTGKIDEVMKIETPLKANGAPWRSFQQVYPLPLDDILTNPNLSQNIGY